MRVWVEQAVVVEFEACFHAVVGLEFEEGEAFGFLGGFVGGVADCEGEEGAEVVFEGGRGGGVGEVAYEEDEAVV